jgi:hypothetical protein
MFTRKSVLTAFGAVLGLAVTASASGWVTWNVSRTNQLTFSGPVTLPSVTLPAGTYVFELPSPLTSPDIVRVRNAARTMVYFTAFTELIDRPDGLPEDQVVSLGEAASGMAPPIVAWYPLGESTGYKFIYRPAR